MSTWYICDHRAPGFMPKKDRDPEMFAYPPAFLLGLASAALVPVAAVVRTLPLILVAAAVVVAFVYWVYLLHRFLIGIPKGNYGEDSAIHTEVRKIQAAYRRHPALRPLIDPVLVAAYGFARSGNRAAIDTRRQAINELISTERATEDSAVNNADLEELRNIIEVRRQMRSEGLL